jgi:hypothetical protein
MSEHTKKHHISAHSHGSTLYITHRHTTYAIPKNIANKYMIEVDKPKKRKKNSTTSVTIKSIFDKLDLLFPGAYEFHFNNEPRKQVSLSLKKLLKNEPGI